jgi:2-polyprenyl-3-methyl-5-hydroxy-6-metoxy-1,4-benzoquinol methylase
LVLTCVAPGFSEMTMTPSVAISMATAVSGVIYNPFADRWQLSSDMDVNYMLAAARDD